MTENHNSGVESSGTVLLTGATGYVGGRLLRHLEDQGVRVRCLARRADRLRNRVADTTSLVEGNVLDREALEQAFVGVETAYYLIHSMGSKGNFEQEDREAARRFADAAEASGVKRIIYLGGLGGGDDLSAHLRSRHEVGEILRSSTVPTLEFRASIVIGSGSLSFEMVRALTEKLPVMITPRWVRSLAQPIAVEDLLAYLDGCRSVPASRSAVIEIGGADQVTYGDIMAEYARQRGLRRIMLPVPVLTPTLSSYWLGLVTPVYARIGRKLLDSVRNATVVKSAVAQEMFPDIRPRGIRDAITRALVAEDKAYAETRWSDSLSSGGALKDWTETTFRSRILDSRTVEVPTSSAAAFNPIQRIGGDVGWYYGDWLWRLRGLIDLAVGGVGSRRGRRHPDELVVGDAVDFWRVDVVEANHRLRLAAEMKLPGRAWLEFEVEPIDSGSRVRQTAEFDPVGLLGLLYWYALLPIHRLVFAGMLRGISRAALERRSEHAERGLPSGTPE